MPYYREQFNNRSVPVQHWNAGSLVRDAAIAMDTAEVTGFRARPHRASIAPVEVSSLSADPYAYFLDSTSRKKYHDRLSERGLQAEGDPDRGHTFDLKRHQYIGPLATVTSVHPTAGTSVYMNCRLYPAITAGTLDSIHTGTLAGPASYQEGDLGTFAQQAYARVAPTSVIFDAGQFLGELREGLPRLTSSILLDKSKLFMNLGSDYLNFEFGWKPFIKDLQNAAKALLGATDMLAQQGKRVHRSYSLPLTHSAGTIASSGALSINLANSRGFASSDSSLGSSFVTTTGALRTVSYDYTKTRNSKRWFEGEFSSFYPLGFDPNDFLQRLSVLVDPKITPSTLWELAPWSWLVDWNLRIGDTIRANEINANDLLIMHYGYAMETAVYSTAVSWRVTSVTSSTTRMSGVPTSAYYQNTTTYKKRLRANPYGFRVGGAGSLSGGQFAILGALGLTKLK